MCCQGPAGTTAGDRLCCIRTDAISSIQPCRLHRQRDGFHNTSGVASLSPIAQPASRTHRCMHMQHGGRPLPSSSLVWVRSSRRPLCIRRRCLGHQGPRRGNATTACLLHWRGLSLPMECFRVQTCQLGAAYTRGADCESMAWCLHTSRATSICGLLLLPAAHTRWCEDRYSWLASGCR